MISSLPPYPIPLSICQNQTQLHYHRTSNSLTRIIKNYNCSSSSSRRRRKTNRSAPQEEKGGDRKESGAGMQISHLSHLLRLSRPRKTDSHSLARSHENNQPNHTLIQWIQLWILFTYSWFMEWDARRERERVDLGLILVGRAGGVKKKKRRLCFSGLTVHEINRRYHDFYLRFSISAQILALHFFTLSVQACISPPNNGSFPKLFLLS